MFVIATILRESRVSFIHNKLIVHQIELNIFNWNKICRIETSNLMKTTLLYVFAVVTGMFTKKKIKKKEREREN